MKALVGAFLVSCAFAAPVCAFAQSVDPSATQSAPVTRAEVRADLVRLEQAGYQPSRVGVDYPAGIQRAEAKIAQQDALASNAVGGVAPTGSSASGGATGGASSGAGY